VSVAVLTGSSRGIGRATALALAGRGLTIAMLGRTSDAQRETERQLTKQGARFAHFACELSSPGSIADAASGVLRELGTPSVVVNNAGIIERAKVSELSDESWQRQLDVNLNAPFRITRAFLPAMLEKQQGRILFVSSISATTGSATQSAYHASKWALSGFMKCLAEELSNTGLMTCALLPGAVATDMLSGSPWPARMTAEDVAKTLCFYALDASVAHNGALVEMFGT
jgi:NAD(P)-dependent dehydrogenase (short-subunit alcohol dehydrogenase family)